MANVQKFNNADEYNAFVAKQKKAGKWAERNSIPSDMPVGEYEGVALEATVCRLSKKGTWYSSTSVELDTDEKPVKTNVLTGDDVFVEEGDPVAVAIQDSGDTQYPRRAVFMGVLDVEPVQQKTRVSIGRKR